MGEKLSQSPQTPRRVIVKVASPGYKWIMTSRPRPENSSEFFVEWQIADGSDTGSDTVIDLSADACQAEAQMAQKSEVKAASGS
jgi:hypothetical protein